MADKIPVVYGMVSGVDESGGLTVELEDGHRGYVEPDKVGRQENMRRESLLRLTGRRMGFVSEGEQADGMILLSAREYEEQEYRLVCDAFETKKRNLYIGHLTSITADGKLAFYRIAQGVIGALHVSSFSLCRLTSFRDIDLPRELSVIVSSIDQRGWLSLSSKPAFGDFEYSVNRLGLSEGMSVEGTIINILAEGAAVVMLAPNLSVLVDANGRVYAGDRVCLKIKRIDRELNRIKAVMLERLEEAGSRFDYSAWCRPAAELNGYVDAEEFDGRIRLKKASSAAGKKAQEEATEAMDFSVNAQRSPFSTYVNERIVREVRRPSRIQDINFEARMGYLGERHIKTAEAVEALKYSSAWQLRRYLYLKEGISLSERELKGIIDRLVKHDIVGVLRFQSDEGSLLTRVLHPSLNYRAFCGHSPRNFGAKDFMENDSSGVKMRLASNQLLIGLMNGWKDAEEIETHPFLRSDETDVRLRPRHTLRRDGKTYYLEAVRKNWEKEICEKLLRYDVLLERRKEDSAVIIVTENEEMVREMIPQIEELRLSFSVWVTTDLDCLPEPNMTEIPAVPKTLLQRIKSKLEEIQS